MPTENHFTQATKYNLPFYKEGKIILPELKELNKMSGSSKADIAGAAVGTVITVDQLMRAIEAAHEHKEDHAKKHMMYAGVGAAVAIGAMELLRRDELKHSHPHPHHHSDSSSSGDEDVEFIERHHHHHDGHDDEEIVRYMPKPDDHIPHGHKRRLAEEIVGAYALGQEIMGHKKHHMAHIVAEALGAIAAVKDTRDHVSGVE